MAGEGRSESRNWNASDSSTRYSIANEVSCQKVKTVGQQMHAMPRIWRDIETHYICSMHNTGKRRIPKEPRQSVRSTTL